MTARDTTHIPLKTEPKAQLYVHINTLQATVYQCNTDGTIAVLQAYSDADVSLSIYSYLCTLVYVYVYLSNWFT